MFEGVLNVIADLRGQVVIADALHTQRSHATYLHGREAFYLFPVAENQPKLFEAVKAMAWQQARSGSRNPRKATAATRNASRRSCPHRQGCHSRTPPRSSSPNGSPPDAPAGKSKPSPRWRSPPYPPPSSAPETSPDTSATTGELE